MDRRRFLETAGAAAAAACLAPAAVRAAGPDPDADPYGVLIDTTWCAGCRSCERACAKANGLPPPPKNSELPEGPRRTSPTQWTVVNSWQTDDGEVTVKRQCMHCLEPACASACLTQAMKKTDEGPVIWREDKCMGCRYCMLSCPFDVPAFEYDSPNPRISKCQMCWGRLAEGETPACVEACPEEALTFGRRSELLHEARSRIIAHPDQYVDHVYGEHEAGGTGVLYLSSVPFDQLGFRTDLGEKPFPEYTRDFLYSVPVVLTLWPMFLLGLSRSRSTTDPATTPEGER